LPPNAADSLGYSGRTASWVRDCRSVPTRAVGELVPKIDHRLLSSRRIGTPV